LLAGAARLRVLGGGVDRGFIAVAGKSGLFSALGGLRDHGPARMDVVRRNAQSRALGRYWPHNRGSSPGIEFALMAPDRLPFTRPDIDEATIKSVADVLRSGWLASGPMVANLERKLSEYLD